MINGRRARVSDSSKFVDQGIEVVINHDICELFSLFIREVYKIKVKVSHQETFTFGYI